MSDRNPSGGRVPSGVERIDTVPQHRLSDREDSASRAEFPSRDPTFEFPQSVLEPQHHQPGSQAFTAPGQHATAHTSGTFDMLGLAGALPDYTPSKQSPFNHPRHAPGPLVTNLGYQGQELPQFAGQMPMNNPGYPVYPTPYASTYQQVPSHQYPQPSPVQHTHFGSPNPSQGTYNNTPYFLNPALQQYQYYSGQSGPASQMHHGQDSQYISSPGRGPHHVYGQDPLSYGYGSTAPTYKGNSGSYSGRSHPNVSSGIIPSSPRGPPRKPKQSGHALWVGNLPSGALVSDLKDHFSRDAFKDIESVFLISKSNCAFVNYRTDAACAAAMTRFHDSRFHGVRLVCRLRRTPASPAAGVPLAPAALLPSIVQSQTAMESIVQNREISSKAEELAKEETSPNEDSSVKRTDRYFVMKSLTVEDMELSLRNSIWATQAHNEDALNKAFENSENVYLIFSANKSGEYFGVARMASRIDEESAKNLEWAPRTDVISDDPDLPRSIPTPATEFAPRGRIIDDSARGTIFWEADPEDEELAKMINHEVEHNEETKSEESAEEAEERQASMGAQAFGKPFKIEWVATNRLPFYRTRGLRNPWNANREVKIARDGTELETSVGRRLLQMFQGKEAKQEPSSAHWGNMRPY